MPDVKKEVSKNRENKLKKEKQKKKKKSEKLEEDEEHIVFQPLDEADAAFAEQFKLYDPLKIHARLIVPGTSVYTIEQVPPTQKRPYVTYKPAMRIVTAVQGDGTGEVALVLAYNPKFEIADNLFDKKKYCVKAQEEVIYSPLRFVHAKCICAELNAQSRQCYKENMRKILRAQKKKMAELAKSNEKTK